MTIKRISASDVLGSNYYSYALSSSSYNPSLNATITISCTMKNVYGDAVASQSLTLYQNGSSVSSQTTDGSGVASWSITCSSGGLQQFRVASESIDVYVDGFTRTDYVTDLNTLDGTGEFVDALDNVIQAMTGRGDDF